MGGPEAPDVIRFSFRRWLEEAGEMYVQAITNQEIDGLTLSRMGGVFGLAARDVRIRVDNDALFGFIDLRRSPADLEEITWKTWRRHARALEKMVERGVDPKVAIESYFAQRGLVPQTLDALVRATSLSVVEGRGTMPAWFVAIWKYRARTSRELELLFSPAGFAGVAATHIVRGTVFNPTREDWDKAFEVAGWTHAVGSVVGPLTSRAGAPRGGGAPAVRDRMVERPKSAPPPQESRGLPMPDAPGPRRGNRGTTPAPPAPLGPPGGRKPAAPAPGRPSPKTLGAAVRRARVPEAERAFLADRLPDDLRDLAWEIGPVRLLSWPNAPRGEARDAIVSHVAGTVLAERLVLASPELQARLAAARAEAAALGISRDAVQFYRGAVQGQTGTRLDVGPGARGGSGEARKGSQLGDGFIGAIVPRKVPPGAAPAFDLHVFHGVETKLVSVVGNLPQQLQKTLDRAEGMGIKVAGRTFVSEATGDRLVMPADRGKPMTWTIAAPKDAYKNASGWAALRQRVARSIGRRTGAVTVVQIPVTNASLRRVAKAILDALTARASPH